MFRSAFMSLMLASLVCPLGGGQVGVGQTPEKASLEGDAVKTIEKLASAFNVGDVKEIAALFTETGEINADDEVLQGRKEIEAAYAKTLGESKPARLEIKINRVRKVSADVLSVEGTARVIRPKQTISNTQFNALLVRQADGWLIDSVREVTLPSQDGNAEHLKDLAWLNGTWKFAQEGTEVLIDCKEVANGNFRSHRFQVKEDGEITHEGTQIIGWDPANKQIRSWVFGSDGSFGDGMWEKKGNQWIIRAVGTSPDGQLSTATQIMTFKDKESFRWQSVDRTVESRVLPNVGPVTLTKSAVDAAKGE